MSRFIYRNEWATKFERISSIFRQMTEADVGDLSLEKLMECARKRALLDDWELRGNDVRLKVGTYEIVLRRQAADRFIRSLLKNYEMTLARPPD